MVPPDESVDNTEEEEEQVNQTKLSGNEILEEDEHKGVKFWHNPNAPSDKMTKTGRIDKGLDPETGEELPKKTGTKFDDSTETTPGNDEEEYYYETGSSGGDTRSRRYSDDPTKRAAQRDKAKEELEDTLGDMGAFDTSTKKGMDNLTAFLEKWDKHPDSVWLSRNNCVSALGAMYREGGVVRNTSSIVTDCVNIAKNMGGEGRQIALSQIQETRTKKEAEIEDEVRDLIGIAQDTVDEDGNSVFTTDELEAVQKQPTMAQQKRAIIKLLGTKAEGKADLLDKLKVKAGKGDITQQMNVLLLEAKNPKTKSGKRANAIAKLETLQQTAISIGTDVPPGVTAFLAVAKEQDLETQMGEDKEKGDRLAGVKGLASELGAGLVTRVAGGGGGDPDDPDDPFTYRKSGGGGFGSKLGTVEMDTDQIGSGAGGVTEMFGGVGVGAVPTSIKSKVLGKETIGSGDLFESSMTASKAGVDLGDWSPRAYDVPEGGETRGEKFLRKRSAPTEGEAGPLGGDLTPGSMSFDFRSGRGPGTARLDLGAGQFTPSTPINLGTQAPKQPQVGGDIYPRGSDIAQTQPRSPSINLGLRSDQRPSSGINLLGTKTNIGVKAPDVNSIVKETNIPTNKPMAGGGIGISAKPGLDKGHLIGTPPKKNKKMNLFGGLPR